MYMEEHSNTQTLVEALIQSSSQSFKFHGVVAMQLFLSDDLELPSKVDICVERKKLIDIVKAIPKHFDVRFFNKAGECSESHNMSLKEITHANVYDEEQQIMEIFVYDVVNDEWIFRLNSQIRLPKNNIYFHSLNYDVDYIKPEIVLMYDLLDNQNYHQFSNYKKVIDSLSYYQFFILKLVVGEKRIKEAILNNKKILED
ncbi:hypothetical protein BU089_09130 [Staphylococcus warneri]|uniref:hypothetical protein n=1 Tax=Staphylococcus warneri TaxID=1292 RepID=UPI000E680AAF|nr:hypothetical protein [Staphylococcus warneri]RIN19774.1 hypothetical protein BU089_09130 [Staphylococcus warneri]